MSDWLARAVMIKAALAYDRRLLDGCSYFGGPDGATLNRYRQHGMSGVNARYL
jgi:hypothetical protein